MIPCIVFLAIKILFMLGNFCVLLVDNCDEKGNIVISSEDFRIHFFHSFYCFSTVIVSLVFLGIQYYYNKEAKNLVKWNIYFFILVFFAIISHIVIDSYLFEKIKIINKELLFLVIYAGFFLFKYNVRDEKNHSKNPL